MQIPVIIDVDNAAASITSNQEGKLFIKSLLHFYECLVVYFNAESLWRNRAVTELVPHEQSGKILYSRCHVSTW